MRQKSDCSIQKFNQSFPAQHTTLYGNPILKQTSLQLPSSGISAHESMQTRGSELLTHHRVPSPFTVRTWGVEGTAKPCEIPREKTIPICRAFGSLHINNLLIESHRWLLTQQQNKYSKFYLIWSEVVDEAICLQVCFLNKIICSAQSIVWVLFYYSL